MSEQGSDEWKRARSGHITASRMGEVLSGCTPKSALCILDARGRIVEKIGNGVAAEKAAAAERAAAEKARAAAAAATAPAPVVREKPIQYPRVPD